MATRSIYFTLWIAMRDKHKYIKKNSYLCCGGRFNVNHKLKFFDNQSLMKPPHGLPRNAALTRVGIDGFAHNYHLVVFLSAIRAVRMQ